MTWIKIVGLLSISALFLPVLLLLFFRLYQNISLLALGFYCFITAVYNLMGEGFLPVPDKVLDVFSVVNNYLDAPLMSSIFFMYGNKNKTRKLLLICMGLFVVYELVILWKFGLKIDSSKYVLGPGVALVFCLGLYFFSYQAKRTLFFGKWMGRTLISAAIVFAYGCYGLIYYFYYIGETPFVADIFLLYYITSFIFSLLVSLAFFYIYQKHCRIKEVQQVRRELALFFGTK